MKYYMAPLESVTTWIYRQAHAKIYGRLDKYFIPFLEPHEKRDFKTRELQEILPEHNKNIYAVPQILTNRSEGFIKLAKALKDWGYEEINLNLGCPSKTVVTKGKGSGFLAKPEELERFLTEIFDALSGEVKISVKTRIGKEDPEEFPALLELFNKYPMEELIIHPRVQKDGYGNVPRLELYELAEKQSVNPLCYNGNLYTREQIRNFAERFPGTERLMFGRGFLRDPGLLYNEGKDSKDIFEKFWAFHDLVYEGYQERNMGDRNVLFKMKELWSYQVYQFSEPERLFKTFKKVQDCNEYEQMIRNLRR
ncbi:tRNA-dihydrouridine synthase family protein [Clostridiaceae bacterium AM27-36LB]|nr:tRNA-dihydrouridine synthase family protein [Clostridiales bacterium AM23-16LB]RHR44257.1 tRNA-dihydrouridine synthase family protein [Clostridiaceae bacterium AF18-31LB]RHT82196.1 tRNA-dihydrouridine synthase family protein [Clostridiaceae bacterium AM27-36LB]RHW00908.1 tRNA-dihydrouridine synthase family protein [Clostridiaceae bacterium OF09-1]